MVVWEGDRVSTRDTVAVDGKLSGARMRDAYVESLPALTFGLVRLHGDAIKLGPVELLRFGRPAVTRQAVTWPIEGGLLAGRAGGQWRIAVTGRRVDATVSGFSPALPRPLYALTHLQVHLLFTRLFLLRLRGDQRPPAAPAASADRVAAATVDAALCLALAGFAGRRRPRTLLAVAAIYHVACWSVSGRTLGGSVMRQRVVAADGTRVTPQQAMLRLVLIPLSWIAWRPLHDRLAYTAVVRDPEERERGGREAASSPQTKGPG